MDPLTVLNTLWKHKWVAFPVILLTIMMAGYVYLFAPRTYEAAVSYAITAPNVPTQDQLESDKKLAALNADNPYLRSTDSSLLTQVVIAKLSDPAYVEELKGKGIGSEFTIAPAASLGMGLVNVTATSTSAPEAVSTAQFIGHEFTRSLKKTQEVNGASDRYLYSPILVRGPGPALEQFSSRLRSVIMVGIAGGVLLFGSVSVAQSITRSRASIAGTKDNGGARSKGPGGSGGDERPESADPATGASARTTASRSRRLKAPQTEASTSAAPASRRGNRRGREFEDGPARMVAKDGDDAGIRFSQVGNTTDR